MAASRSTLSFETMGAAVVHLHGLGYGIDAIVRKVGSTTGSVRKQLHRAQLIPHKVATDNSGQHRQFLTLSPKLVRGLRPHASRRGLSSTALAGRLLDIIVADCLVDATLDDRED